MPDGRGEPPNKHYSFVARDHVETIREYYRVCDQEDWDAAGAFVGPGYVWIDHATGVFARTPTELAEAVVDEAPWCGTSRIQITNSLTPGDDVVVIQGVRSGTITGSWRGIDVTGQPVTFPFCVIFRFDPHGLINHEEQYYDMLAVRQQLGYS